MVFRFRTFSVIITMFFGQLGHFGRLKGRTYGKKINLEVRNDKDMGKNERLFEFIFLLLSSFKDT